MEQHNFKALGKERKLARVQALHGIIADFSAEFELSRWLDRIVERLGEVFEAEAVAIFLKRDGDDPLPTVVHSGLSVEFLAALREQYPSPPNWWEQFKGPMQIVDAARVLHSSEFADEMLRAGFRSALLLPLAFGGNTLGALALFHKYPNTYDDEEFILAAIVAQQVATTIRNSHLYRQLREALETKDAFLSIVSHELKTPLTSILAYTQHLLLKLPEAGQSGDMRSHLDVINSQARRMTRLVQELLDLSALEKGELQLKKTVIDLGGVVQNSVLSARASSTKHQILLERPGHPVTIFADIARIGQVVNYLIENAIKYSPQGGSIRILLRETPDEAVVSISDQGVGIATEHLPHIFERFYQADNNPRTRRFGGMGLGLFVSKEMVEGHGGKLWVESKKGEGSTFHFAFPLHLNPRD